VLVPSPIVEVNSAAASLHRAALTLAEQARERARREAADRRLAARRRGFAFGAFRRARLNSPRVLPTPGSEIAK